MFHHRIDGRVELRQLAAGDAVELFDLTDANRARLRQWMPWLDGTKSAADTAAFIQSALRQHEAGQGFTSGILVDGVIGGVIGYHEISRANRRTSLGYWLAAAHEGHGIVTRACRALVQHAFTELDLNRIEIRCAGGNVRSCAVPERLGFRREGLLREAEWLYDHFVDHVVFGLVRSEWSALG